MAGVVSTWRRLVGWAQLLTYDEHARYADFNHRVLAARLTREQADGDGPANDTGGRPAAYWYERAKHAMAVLSASAQARLEVEQDRARRHALADDVDDLRQVWALLDEVQKRGHFG